MLRTLISLTALFTFLLAAVSAYAANEAPPPATATESPSTPQAAVSAAAVAIPTAIEPKSEASKKAGEKLFADLKRQCERHFPGQIQSEVRAACSSTAVDFIRIGKALSATRCRLTYGEEPRLVMSCLIGTSIAEDLVANREDYKKKLQLCGEYYPVHNEIDAFLQESCLTGIHMPGLMNADGKARFEACAQITPERSFIGPCAVGLSLAQDAGTATAAAVPPAQLNRICEQYFNLHQFHKGYRACLNARSLVPDLNVKPSEAVKTVIADCSNILSEANNDTERAACFVGLTIYRHLMKQDDVSKRFQKCGDNKVTYQDRDFLACLTAASLLDFTDRNGAEKGCKDVFSEKRSKSRSDCLSSLTIFN